jgi:hypothetical protein
MTLRGTLSLDAAAVVSIGPVTPGPALLIDEDSTINAPSTSTLTVTTATLDGCNLDVNMAPDLGSTVTIGTFTDLDNPTLKVNDGGILTVGTFTFDDTNGHINVNEDAQMVVQNTSFIQHIKVDGNSDKAKAIFEGTGTRIHFAEAHNKGVIQIKPRGATVGAGGPSAVRTLIVESYDLGAPNGSFDLTDNVLLVDYSGGSPLQTVRSNIGTAHSGGWINSAGISSSFGGTIPNGSYQGLKGANGYLEATDLFTSFPATFANQSGIDNTTIIIKYTFYGDAKLDGDVDVDDLGILATNWQASNQFWINGDFDYDGSVGVNDLGLLASNWQAGTTNPPGPLFAGGDPVQDFLEGIAKLELSEDDIAKLLENLGQGGGDPL